MARARNIKPGFFENEELADAGAVAMVLFAGLWTLADRVGRLEDRPKRIKAKVLPYFDVDADELLNALQERGFIKRYEVAGQPVIEVANFLKHQNPHKDERASTLPEPEEPVPFKENHEESPVQTPEEHRTNPADSLNTDSLSLDSGIPDTNAPAALKPVRYSSVFEDFWREWSADGSVTKGHGSKFESYGAWKNLGLDARNGDGARQLVYDGLAAWRACGRWKRGYVKDCQRWLGKRMFSDEPPVDTEDNGKAAPTYYLDPEPTTTPEQQAQFEQQRQEAAQKALGGFASREEKWLHDQHEKARASPIPRS